MYAKNLNFHNYYTLARHYCIANIYISSRNGSNQSIAIIHCKIISNYLRFPIIEANCSVAESCLLYKSTPHHHLVIFTVHRKKINESTNIYSFFVEKSNKVRTFWWSYFGKDRGLNMSKRIFINALTRGMNS